MATGTSNPAGSTAVEDLLANTINLDNLSVGTEPTYTDRLGVARKSYKGFETEFTDAIESASGTTVEGLEAVRDEALAARDASESARDAAITGSEGVYADTASGLADTLETERFVVANATGWQLFLHDTGDVATALSGVYPSIETLQADLDVINARLDTLESESENFTKYGEDSYLPGNESFAFTDENGYPVISAYPDQSVDFKPSEDLKNKISAFNLVNNPELFFEDAEFVYVDENQVPVYWFYPNGEVGFNPNLSTAIKTAAKQYISPDQINIDANAFGASYVNTGGLVRFFSDVEGVTRSYLQRTDIDSNTSMFEAKGKIEYIPASGQSLSIGGGASENPSGQEVFTTTPVYPNHNFMFNTGTRGRQNQVLAASTLIDFVPAFEQFDGANAAETQGSGMMRALHAAHVDNAEPFKTYAFRSHGKGGASITELQSDSVMYQNGLKELQKAVDIAAKYGRDIVVRQINFSQGEQDQGSMSYQTYYDNLSTLTTSYFTDYPPLLPADNPQITFVIDQLCASHHGNGSPVQIAQYRFAKDEANVTISTPKYHLSMSGSVHLKPKFYSILGEYQAKVQRALEAGDTWEPLWPTSAALSEAVITLVFNVPVGSLQFTTDVLPAATDFGFEYIDDSGSTPAITDVQITSSDTVEITLASTPSATNKLIRYAYDGPGTASGTRSGAWGNLSDSDVTPSQSDPNFLLRNYCVTFEETL